MMDIFKSRRVQIFLASIIAAAGARFGLDVDQELVNKILELAMVLVGSFGLTGMGKERGAEAAKSGGSTASIEVTTTNPPPIAQALADLPPPLGRQRRPGYPTPTTQEIVRTLSEKRAMRAEVRSTPVPQPGTAVAVEPPDDDEP